MVKFDKKKVKALHRKIHEWYEKNRRQLIWRTTTDPYTILVSEIMLQQTQVSRVQEKLPLFLKKFPAFQQLAQASRADVIRAWQGLGYNNRAVRLLSLVKIVVNDYQGKLPSNIEKLQQLPGIGRYTAHAIVCFAFKKRVPVVDVNIQRVLSRLFWKMSAPFQMKRSEDIWRFAEKILPRDAFRWNQALMDLGALVCTARQPSCTVCPVAEFCTSSNRIGTVKQKRSMVSKKKSEPTYDGIPQRIWRGRLVEIFRCVNGKGTISMPHLGKAIKPTFTKREVPWLDRLVQTLQQDGIVDRVGNNVMLAHE
ncbi:MAG: A/G-specific adenine glycosylase [Ignavibacteriae bacterium]|nr:A/G-specific adenine glycosylase [Ignavibacteriota bacterium]